MNSNNKKSLLKIVILIAICSIILCFASCLKINREDCMASVLEIAVLDIEGNAINKGTGFCVRDENTVLSVAHLFEQLNEKENCIKGYTISGEEIDLVLIDINNEKDLALLEIINTKMKPLTLS